jgi:hypothetical protein
LASTALTATVSISIASEKVGEHAGDDGESEEVGQVGLSVAEQSTAGVSYWEDACSSVLIPILTSGKLDNFGRHKLQKFNCDTKK